MLLACSPSSEISPLLFLLSPSLTLVTVPRRNGPSALFPFSWVFIPSFRPTRRVIPASDPQGEERHALHNMDTNSYISPLLPFYISKTITDIHEFNLTVYLQPAMLVKGCNKPTEKLSAPLPHILSNRLFEEVHITHSVGTHTSSIDPNDSIWYSYRRYHVSRLLLPLQNRAHSLLVFSFFSSSLCLINKLIIFVVHNKRTLKPDTLMCVWRHKKE